MSEARCGIYPTEAKTFTEAPPKVCEVCTPASSGLDQSPVGVDDLASRFQKQREVIQSANCPISPEEKQQILTKIDEEEALAIVARNKESPKSTEEIERKDRLREQMRLNARNRNPYACTELEIAGHEIYRDVAGRVFGELDYRKRDDLAAQARQRLLQVRREVADELGKPESEILFSKGLIAEVIDSCAKEIEGKVEGDRITHWSEETPTGKVEYSISTVNKTEDQPNFIDLKIARNELTPDRVAGIVRPEEIIDKDWKIFEAVQENGRRIRVIYPEDPDFEQTVGTTYRSICEFFNSMPKVIDPKGVISQPEVNVYLLDPKNLPRAFADGADIFIAINRESHNIYSYAVLAHEDVHAIFEENFGRCLVPALAEGAAVYYAKRRFPGDKAINYIPSLPYKDDVFQAFASGAAAISHTYLLEQKPEIKAAHVSDYEYSYSLGSAFLQLMQRTSVKRGNLYDGQTGQQVIKEGMKVSSQRAIINAALGSLGLKPEEVIEAFSKYVRENYAPIPVRLDNTKVAASV